MAHFPRSWVSQIQVMACSGFSLIELLIALLLVALSVLGVAGLQLSLLQQQQQVWLQTRAVQVLNNGAERIFANAGQLTALDRSLLQQDIAQALPQGVLQITQNQRQYVLEAQWVTIRSSLFSQCNAAGSSQQACVDVWLQF